MQPPHANRRVTLFVLAILQTVACTDSDPAAPDNSAGSSGRNVIVVDNTASIGDALCFDGDDAVVLDTNPLEALAAFTLQALVRIDAVTAAEFAEPRGVRQNLRYWFQGCIRELRINDHALAAGELQTAN